jgi:hypothetical protein
MKEAKTMSKRTETASKIVADGADRALCSAECHEGWAKIEARVRRKYTARMEGVGLLGWMKLAFQRNRELARKRRAYVAKTAPEWGLYAVRNP